MGSIFMEYKLPELGEGISEGTIAKVLIKAGDTVAEGQPVLELETDKAVLEVPSTVSGTVQNVNVKEGGKAKVGEVIFEYQESNGAAPKEESAPEQEPAPAPEEKPAKSTSATKPASGGITEYPLPELGE